MPLASFVRIRGDQHRIRVARMRQRTGEWAALTPGRPMRTAAPQRGRAPSPAPWWPSIAGDAHGSIARRTAASPTAAPRSCSPSAQMLRVVGMRLRSGWGALARIDRAPQHVAVRAPRHHRCHRNVQRSMIRDARQRHELARRHIRPVVGRASSLADGATLTTTTTTKPEAGSVGRGGGCGKASGSGGPATRVCP